MYYNHILRIWEIDLIDIVILSFVLGSLTASRLKDYLSEEQAMKRLKNSLLQKSTLVIKSDSPISNSKEMRIRKIYKFALGNRGGQFEHFQGDMSVSNESVFTLAQKIKGIVERLASFLKERELKGVARIFFKNGRLLLELILYKCRIDISYLLLTEGLSTQVVVITCTVGGAAGFVLSWFSAAAGLVAPPLLLSIFFIRSVTQQIANLRDYSKFKKLLHTILEDEELQQTIRVLFMEGEVQPTTGLEMKPWNSDKNPLPQFHSDSTQTFEQFIKERMKEELGLIENPTPEQIQEILHSRKIPRNKGKTVYFKDFIDKLAEDQDAIIDAEIVKESRRVKVKNKEF